MAPWQQAAPHRADRDGRPLGPGALHARGFRRLHEQARAAGRPDRSAEVRGRLQDKQRESRALAAPPSYFGGGGPVGPPGEPHVEAAPPGAPPGAPTPPPQTLTP